jgi:hypothetical protein
MRVGPFDFCDRAGERERLVDVEFGRKRMMRDERMTAEYSDAATTATRQEPGKPAVSLNAFYGLMPQPPCPLKQTTPKSPFGPISPVTTTT